MSLLLKCLDRDGNVVDEQDGVASHERVIVDMQTMAHRRFRAERIEYVGDEVDAKGDRVVAFIVYREVEA